MLQTQPIGNRVILLTAGVGLAFFAIWGGSEVGPPPSGWTILLVLWWAVAFVVFCVGMNALGDTYKSLTMYDRLDSLENCRDALIAASAFGFVFGIVVRWFSDGAWLTPWLFLLILGFIPMAIAIKDVIADASDVLNARAVSAGHVREVR